MLAPIHEHPDLLADLGDWMPYPEAQSVVDEDYPDGMRHYWQSLYLDEVTDEALETMHRFGRERPSPESSLDLWVMGGAVLDVEPGLSSFPHRSARYMVAIEANWEHASDDEASIAWTRQATDALEPLSTGGFYMNFAGSREEHRSAARSLYTGSYDRILAIQERADPAGLFTGAAALAPER